MTGISLTPRELLDAVRDRSGSDSRGVLAIADENLDAMTARLTPEDAETCRMAMLAAAELHEYPTSTLWRGRALARFTRLDWHAGSAVILMTDIFRLLEMVNGIGYEELTLDQLKPAPNAIALLAELRPVADEPDPGYGFGPTPQLIARIVAEKTGFLHLLARDWDAARVCYTEALQFVAGEPRGEVKVPLGLALVDYLADRAAGGDGGNALQRTRDLVAGRDPNRLEFLRQAQTNADRMSEGRVDLVAYELL